MEKLIVVLILLAFFGAVIFVIQVNYRREMRDRAARAPTLDDQLDTVIRAGLPLTPGVNRDTLLRLRSEDDYQHDPWRLLMFTLAQHDTEGRPLSPKAALIDPKARMPNEGLERLTGHRPVTSDLEAALGACARQLTEGVALWVMQFGTQRAVFVLPDAGADRINALSPGCLQRVAR